MADSEFVGCGTRMRRGLLIAVVIVWVCLTTLFPRAGLEAQESGAAENLDRRVNAFLNSRQGTWVDP